MASPRNVTKGRVLGIVTFSLDSPIPSHIHTIIKRIGIYLKILPRKCAREIEPIHSGFDEHDNSLAVGKWNPRNGFSHRLVISSPILAHRHFNPIHLCIAQLPVDGIPASDSTATLHFCQWGDISLTVVLDIPGDPVIEVVMEFGRMFQCRGRDAGGNDDGEEEEV